MDAKHEDYKGHLLTAVPVRTDSGWTADVTLERHGEALLPPVRADVSRYATAEDALEGALLLGRRIVDDRYSTE